MIKCSTVKFLIGLCVLELISFAEMVLLQLLGQEIS